VRQQRIGVAKHILIGAEAESLGRGSERERNGPVDVTGGQPMLPHQPGRGRRLFQPLRNTAMQGLAPVRRNAIEQRLAQQGMAKAIAAVFDRQYAGGQPTVETNGGILAGVGGQRHRGGDFELFGGEGQATQRLHARFVLVPQASGDGRGEAAWQLRSGGAGQLRCGPCEFDHCKREAFGQCRQRCHRLGLQRRRRRASHQQGRLLFSQRPQFHHVQCSSAQHACEMPVQDGR